MALVHHVCLNNLCFFIDDIVYSEHLVIVSGESSRHLRRMAEALLRQVQ